MAQNSWDRNMKFGPKTMLLNKAWGSVVAHIPFAAPCFRLDLADLKDVKSFKNRFTSQDYGFLVASDAPWKFTAGSCVGLGKRIDVLMNNAGVMAIPERQETKDPIKKGKKRRFSNRQSIAFRPQKQNTTLFRTWRAIPGALIPDYGRWFETCFLMFSSSPVLGEYEPIEPRWTNIFQLGWNHLKLA